MEVTHIFPVHSHSAASTTSKLDVELQTFSRSDEFPNPVASSVASDVSERSSEHFHGIVDLGSG